MVLRHEVLEHFASPALGIHSFHCRDNNRDFGPAEIAEADQIVFVRGGGWELRLGRETHVVDPNRVVHFRRGDAYRVRHPVRGGDRCTVLTLRARESRRGSGDEARHGSGAGSPTRVLEVDSRAFLLHRAVLASLETNPDAFAIEETTLALVGSLVRAASAARTSRRTPARIETSRTHREITEQVRRLLAAHFRERVLLSDVAESMLWSPYHLARVFRRVAGMPIHRYLTRLRLRFALERLADSRAPIALVAAEAGFSSQAHLGTTFRAEFGLPPAQLRCGFDAAALREMSKILEA